MECAIIWKAKFRSRHGGNDRKMKNHVNVDGRLLQTNKKYSQPKVSQKEKIAERLFQEKSIMPVMAYIHLENICTNSGCSI